MIAQDRRESPLERSVSNWIDEATPAPEWLKHQREHAREYFRHHGLPTTKVESFRFLPLSSVVSEALGPAASSGQGGTFDPLGTPVAATIGFVDGRLIGCPSALPRGLMIERMSGLLQSSPDAVKELFGSACVPIHGFSAVALASFDDAWIIRVAPDCEVELPVDLVVQQTQGRSWARPRLLVALEPNSTLKLIERHVSSLSTEFGLTGGAFEIALANNARLDHVRLCHRDSHDVEVTATVVRVGAGARYHSWTATSGGKLTRFDTHVHLVGASAAARLDGIYLARGQDIIDHHTLVVHECPHTKVEESYKGIVDEEARAIFDGQIIVRPGAVGSDAQQVNRNLLLSDRATIHTKPQLQIDADDVVCSHGATVGKLDEQQLFYLQSRGVSATRARQLLTQAFAADLLDRCPLPQVLPHFVKHLQAGLPFAEQGIA